MNRRDLLKRSGALALGLPALRATSLAGSLPEDGMKDLLVSIRGPFCFWLESKGLRIMAPHVGPNFKSAPHQPWIGTNANQKMIPSGADYSLQTGSSNSNLPAQTGTPIFNYPQGKDPRPPMFNFVIPIPDKIAGGNPSLATMVCTNGNEEPYCKKPSFYATALTVLYSKVDLTQVKATSGDQLFFKPCFENDAVLPVAQLGIHLTPLQRAPGHGQAELVWTRMIALYPWMQKEIKGISLSTFDTSSCPPQPVPLGSEARPMIGPGNNCESPIMLLTGGGSSTRQKG